MNELQQIIRAEIDSKGPITCARFMELALYHPEYGYYERQSSQVGRSGDFITSVSVGRLFGRLLAERFARWLHDLSAAGVNPPYQIVEAGAHTGQLAADILSALQTHPAVFAQTEYVILEPSARRQQWQREQLKDWNVTWWREWQKPIRGVIFSNELLDAFPVHRFIWRNETWRELAVNSDWRWVEIDGAPSFELQPQILAALPDGFVAEEAPGATTWWRAAADALQAGWLMTMDYGIDSGAPVFPDRPHGTLRAYHRHRSVGDLLDGPGEQDLTSHVNWSIIRQAGESSRLETIELSDQSRFLTRILALALAAAAEQPRTSNSKEATPSRVQHGDAPQKKGAWRLSPNEVRQFQTLTHPEHLGRKFQTLVQHRKPR